MKNKMLFIIPLLFSFISLASCSSRPTFQVNNTKITLVADDYEMIPGQHTKIRAQAINFSSSLLEITSSDDRIVSVSNQDEIIAHQEGTAIITASKKDDKEVSVSMEITVHDTENEDFIYYDFDNYYGRRKSLNSRGKQNVLVLPVAVDDYLYNATEATLNRIKEVFMGKDEKIWESVSSYYYKSSYGALDLNFIIPDEWFYIHKNPLELQKKYALKSGYESDGGSGKVTELALEWYKETYHPSATTLDQNQDGWVDAIWTIYSCPTMGNQKEKYELLYPGIDVMGYWAFTTTTFQYNNKGGKGDVGSPLPKVYGWASFDFMNGYQNTSYDYDVDAHTFIHETGHILGLKDYYCTTSPYYTHLGCIDMMDINIGDHCAFSKYALGWVKPKIVTEAMRIELRPFEENGDCLILTNKNYNNTPFDEYFMIEYITPTGLNEQDYTAPYPDNSLQGYSKPGIRITHVDNPAVRSGDGELVTYVKDKDQFLADPNINTPYFYLTYKNELGIEEKLEQYLITLMQKNVGTAKYKVTDERRAYLSAIKVDENGNQKQDPNDALFFENDSFSLKKGSPYRALMPGKGAKLNKYYHHQQADDIFDFQVDVISLTEEKAVLEISRLDHVLL